MALLLFIIIIIFASWMIARACDGFEASADYLGRNMTEGTKGATINAIGSSMPELLVTFIYLFFFHDTTGFSGGIGTTAGSAVFNAMIIPALVIISVLWFFAASTKIQVSKSVLLRDGIFLISAELFLIYAIGEVLYWYHGLFLMLIYIFYASWMVYRHKMNNGNNCVCVTEADEEDSDFQQEDSEITNNSRLISFFKIDLENAIIGNKAISNGNASLLLFISTLFIAAACWLLVYSCENIGIALNLHGYFVAVIIAAAASSVPDTILSIKDAKKGNYDDALANALGSNIFDICFALGAPLFLYTIIYNPVIMTPDTVEHIVELRLLLLILTILTFIVFLSSKKMTKLTAGILISMYLAFVLYVAGRAYDVGLASTIAEKLHIIQGLIQ
jgi:cation:H+ antiporter